MKPYHFTSICYFLFGVLWIVVSDQLIQIFTRDPENSLLIQTAKGWLYVALSSGLVYLLSKKAYRDQIAAEKEKYSVFRKTVEASHHILLNYLNQMQLLILKAEECPQIEREILDLANESTASATAELMKLRDLQDISPSSIDSTIYARVKRGENC